MNFHSNFDAAHAIARMAQDAWHARRHLLKEVDGVTKPVYIPYRMSISDHSVDKDVDFYVHLVIEHDYVYYTISDEMDGRIDQDTLRFREDKEISDFHIRASSYRHYIFSDLLQPALLKKMDNVAAKMAKPQQVYLWGTMPLREFDGDLDKPIPYL